jgi:hypothetical protein
MEWIWRLSFAIICHRLICFFLKGIKEFCVTNDKSETFSITIQSSVYIQFIFSQWKVLNCVRASKGA